MRHLLKLLVAAVIACVVTTTATTFEHGNDTFVRGNSQVRESSYAAPMPLTAIELGLETPKTGVKTGDPRSATELDAIIDAHFFFLPDFGELSGCMSCLESTQYCAVRLNVCAVQYGAEYVL
eukprot:Lankesteria_metandrocarpae@DN9929_c0_g1_i1.p2